MGGSSSKVANTAKGATPILSRSLMKLVGEINKADKDYQTANQLLSVIKNSNSAKNVAQSIALYRLNVINAAKVANKIAEMSKTGAPEGPSQPEAAEVVAETAEQVKNVRQEAQARLRSAINSNAANAVEKYLNVLDEMKLDRLANLKAMKGRGIIFFKPGSNYGKFQNKVRAFPMVKKRSGLRWHSNGERVPSLNLFEYKNGKYAPGGKNTLVNGNRANKNLYYKIKSSGNGRTWNYNANNAKAYRITSTGRIVPVTVAAAPVVTSLVPNNPFLNMPNGNLMNAVNKTNLGPENKAKLGRALNARIQFFENAGNPAGASALMAARSKLMGGGGNVNLSSFKIEGQNINGRNIYSHNMGVTRYARRANAPNTNFYRVNTNQAGGLKYANNGVAYVFRNGKFQPK